MATASGERRADLWSRLVLLSNRLQVTYWLMVTGSLATRLLPLRVTYAIATALGDLVFYTWGEKRRAALANMRRVLGPDADPNAVWRTARQSYRNYVKYTVDFLRFPWLDQEDFRQRVTYEGKEHLDEALAGGKGVLFVGMHFGHFDWGAAAMAAYGYSVCGVVDTFEPPRLNEHIQRHREKVGVKVIQLESAGRAVLRALRKGDILGLLVDKPLPGEGVRVNFFGEPIEIPAGAATLSLKTGAPIVPGYILRVGRDRFHGVIMPRIDFRPSGDLGKDIVELTQKMVNALEHSIRHYPDQWYMFRRMWRDAGGQAAGAG